MTGRMTDAVDPANIPADLDGRAALRITVLANPAGQAFDVEPGNAPAAEAAPVMIERLRQGLWSVGYCDWNDFPTLTAELRKAGTGWATAASWPAPGVYLWAADPDRNIAAGKWNPGVEPLAVQITDLGTVDYSDTAGRFPAEVAGYLDGPRSEWPSSAWDRFAVIDNRTGQVYFHGNPPPGPQPPLPSPPVPPPPSEVCSVQLLVLRQGAEGSQVRAAQTLLGGVAVDGIFGPVTHARVVEFQTVHRLAADGVIGAHTWGSLLGAPQ